KTQRTTNSTTGIYHTIESDDIFADGSRKVNVRAGILDTLQFKEGEKVGYEITKTNQYGSLGKVHKLEAVSTQISGSSSFKEKNASFALSYAKDVYIGLYGAKEPAEVAQDITDLADIFKTWLDNN
ncbi:MAG: hypothetical protein ACPGC5_07470, partial [Flavobacteriaceae bacterium]